MPVTKENVNDIVSYHQPSEEAISAIQNIRAAAATMIGAILDNAPMCADQSAAVRHVREAMMTANAAIVLKGKV